MHVVPTCLYNTSVLPLIYASWKIRPIYNLVYQIIPSECIIMDVHVGGWMLDLMCYISDITRSCISLLRFAPTMFYNFLKSEGLETREPTCI